VIEHNLDVIKTADYIIDLGQEGGDRGGTVVASGTPEEVAECEDSYTGLYIKKELKKAAERKSLNEAAEGQGQDIAALRQGQDIAVEGQGPGEAE
jgi:hypothetical protein